MTIAQAARPTLHPTREQIAEAIRRVPTTYDGDPLGVHLSLSQNVQNLPRGVDESRRIVGEMCLDAADAVLKLLNAEPTP